MLNRVTSRISKLIPLIHQVRDSLSSSSLREKLFCSDIPSLTYCIAVWGSSNSTVNSVSESQAGDEESCENCVLQQ